MAASKLCIVYHSQSGANEALAKAAYNGASKAAALSIQVFRACDVASKDLLNCDGLVLCFAEMNATIAGGMKECLDRVYYPLIAHQKVLPTAVYLSVGNDGSGALALYQRIATGLNLKPVSEPTVIVGEPSASQLQMIEDQSHGFAEGITMGIF